MMLRPRRPWPANGGHRGRHLLLLLMWGPVLHLIHDFDPLSPAWQPVIQVRSSRVSLQCDAAAGIRHTRVDLSPTVPQ